MAGKNHVERSVYILIDDSGGTARNLSGDLIPGSLQGGGFVYDTAEMTGVSDAAKNYLAAHPTSEISADFHMNDTATTGSLTVLNARQGTGGTLEIRWGQNGAAPTSGDPQWDGEYVLIDCSVKQSGNTTVLSTKWAVQAGTTAPAFGTV